MSRSCSPFASRSIALHLARGAIGFAGLAGSALLLRQGGTTESAGAVPAALLGLYLLRGCPMCWVVGLVETASIRKHRPERMRTPEREMRT